MMYHTIKILVNQKHEMYSYFDEVTHFANNMYNATLFRLRQVLSGLNKDEDKLTANEKEVLDEITNTLPLMGSKFKMPVKGRTYLNYNFMDALLKRSRNPDYEAQMLPRQCAQNAIKDAVHDMKVFYSLCREFKKAPKKFKGKPNLPNYHKKGGKCTLRFTNQSCTIDETDDCYFMNFAKTKLKLNLGKSIKNTWILKQVTVKPYHDIFQVLLVFDDCENNPIELKEPTRICAIDLGVNNFAAVSNNVGLPCLLFKGGTIKSANQWYNKNCARIQSGQTTGTTDKFKSTRRYKRMCIKRSNILEDYMHKVSKSIINWCLANEIDTIVVGSNKHWKQESELGKKENQNFVQIPYDRFKWMLEYLCQYYGIRFIRQEEAYTSRASFLDNDDIPDLSANKDEISFSGKRKPKYYKGMYKSNGFRGLYKAKDGTIINSDLNGSANIGRKVFPSLFSNNSVNFDEVLIIKHPDDFKCNPAWDKGA